MNRPQGIPRIVIISAVIGALLALALPLFALGIAIEMFADREPQILGLLIRNTINYGLYGAFLGAFAGLIIHGAVQLIRRLLARVRSD